MIEIVSMSVPQSLFVIVLGLGLLGLVLLLVRGLKLRERYSMLWVFIALAMTTVPIFYSVYRIVAGFVGIKDINSFFFFMAIVGICLLCLQFSLALSSAYDQRKALVQKVAVLEERLSRLEKNGADTDKIQSEGAESI